MKKTLLISLCFALAMLFIFLSAQNQVSRAQVTTESYQNTGKFRKGPNAVPGRYIVVLKDNVTTRDMDSVETAMRSSYGGTIAHVYKTGFKGFSGQMSETAASLLSEDPRVAYVMADAVSVPLEPSQGGLITQDFAPWGLDRIDERSIPTDGKYRYYYTAAGVNVYILDTGIRRTHEQFAGRAFLGADIPNDGFFDRDIHGHGTGLASLIGGFIIGAAKNVNLYSVRIGSATIGGSSYLSDAIAGVQWVTNNARRPAVALFAFGFVDPNQAYLALDQAVNASIASGVTYVVSAGNNGALASTQTPARVASTLCVGATNQLDQKPGVSNFGASLDLFAPGWEINLASNVSDSSYATLSGSSPASAYAAGVAATYVGRLPVASFLPSHVTYALVRNATPNRLASATLGAGSPNRLLYSRFRAVSTVNAASYSSRVAPNSMVALFGPDLQSATAVRVSGVPATILGVYPGQINYAIPSSTSIGTNIVDIDMGDEALGSGIIEAATVAPGLFSANGSGQGPASALVLRVRGDGSQVFESVAYFDSAQNRYVLIPIDFGPETDQIFLILYGTGIRGRSSLSAVAATVGGLNMAVTFAGAVPGYVGLDQVNARLTRNLIGRGEVNVVLNVDGQVSNTVTIATR